MEKNYSVLVVDDEQIHRTVLRNILEKEFAATVREAACPKDALDQLQVELPDMIVLDMHMPGMDGLTFLLKIRNYKRTAQIPVVACTAISSKSLLVELVRAGIKDYVIKPYARSTVIAKFKNVLDELRPAHAQSGQSASDITALPNDTQAAR